MFANSLRIHAPLTLTLLLALPVMAQDGSKTAKPQPKNKPKAKPKAKAKAKPEPKPEPKPESEEELVVDPVEDTEDKDLGTETIVGTDEEKFRQTGSAYSVDDKELDRYEYDDINRILRLRPGVYVREEEGYGLRPNIGIRGVSSERSAKIVLMEDGVLFAPAPYSAPAAYYFPLSTRMSRVEIFKGPAAIKYGPNTIGGAVNLVSRRIPERKALGVDVALGTTFYRKGHVFAGASNDNFGVLVEGVHVASDGFKSLDGGGKTGFEKNEAMFKFRVQSDPNKNIRHRFEVKFGYADEQSNETYLGLSEGDFRQDPYRRYVASSRDQMDWDWYSYRVDYSLFYGDDLEFKLTGYRQDFERAWNRFGRFSNGPDVRTLLQDPSGTRNQLFFNVLTGAADSSSADQTLQVTRNHRRFVSQGVQLSATHYHETEEFLNKLDFGLRLHNDTVRRDHTEKGFLVRSGRLTPDSNPIATTTRNNGETVATSLFVVDELTFGKLTLSPGFRVEYINNRFKDHLTRQRDNDTQTVFLPGVGMFYEFFEGIGVLAGVYRGYSPLAPGQSSNADPEFSNNYEFGVRAWNDTSSLEVIGFFNDYSNLTSICTIAGGCPPELIGTQFNGEDVEIFGVEVLGQHKIYTDWGPNFAFQAAYTYTFTRFLSSFVSSNPQFGAVITDDALPYVPEHQVSAAVGAFGETWNLFVNMLYVGEQFETAAHDKVPRTEVIQDYVTFDVTGQVTFEKRHTLYFRIDNIFNAEYKVSRRPFGARPGKPFLATVGYKFNY